MNETENLMTIEEARGYLRDAVATQGDDFVYSPGGDGGCFYLPTGEDYYAHDSDTMPPSKRLTGCVVGVALLLAGRTKDQLQVSEQVASVAWRLRLSTSAAEYLRAAQEIQDNGGTWGEALAEAEKYWETVRDSAVSDA